MVVAPPEFAIWFYEHISVLTDTRDIDLPLRLIGVAGVRISAAGLCGNDAVWLGLLVTAFASEENCMGYVQNPGTLVP